ncbi:hypothetical protein A5717_26240 [Mycolicibacterium porcinum]|uniref:hypothetical protein n=1 Tax=Mycolicibacterium porcinum TaxID=39693 RepID=UPI00080B4BCD|nr:hypothetical protein [Mycolicibacterium porcinum]OCB09275.1 hypothetical protein A5717_26240 [Mycolicibacterium porcinum]
MNLEFWFDLGLLIIIASVVHAMSRGKSAQTAWPQPIYVAWAFLLTTLLPATAILVLTAVPA